MFLVFESSVVLFSILFALIVMFSSQFTSSVAGWRLFSFDRITYTHTKCRNFSLMMGISQNGLEQFLRRWNLIETIWSDWMEYFNSTKMLITSLKWPSFLNFLQRFKVNALPIDNDVDNHNGSTINMSAKNDNKIAQVSFCSSLSLSLAHWTQFFC